MNKLAEIMNRKEVRGGGSRRGNDTDVRRKEKENRKLQLELRSEKEKLNSTSHQIPERNQRHASSMTAYKSEACYTAWHIARMLVSYSCLFPAATGRRVSGARRAADGSGQ